MDILQNLTNLLGGGAPASSNQYAQSGYAQSGRQQNAGGMGGLSELLNPAVLGSLASALLSSNKSSGIAASAQRGGQADGGMGMLGGLLSGMLGGGSGAGGGMGGAGGMGGLGMLGGLLSGMLGGGDEPQAPADYGRQAAPAPMQAPRQQPMQSNPQDRAVRVLRTLVYAAKADGHIDANEQAVLNSQVQKLNLGQQVRDLLRQFITEPLDPNAIANGVRDPQEAAQLYGLSCAITGMDDPMERAYLDSLAAAFRLPPQAKQAIESQVLGR